MAGIVGEYGGIVTSRLNDGGGRQSAELEPSTDRL